MSRYFFGVCLIWGTVRYHKDGEKHQMRSFMMADVERGRRSSCREGISVQIFPHAVSQPLIILRQHKTEPEIGVVRTEKRRAVTDHQTPADGIFKKSGAGTALFENPGQHKICLRPVHFDTVHGRKKMPHTAALAPDQFFRLLYMFCVGKEQLPGHICQTAHCPRILPLMGML